MEAIRNGYCYATAALMLHYWCAGDIAPILSGSVRLTVLS